MPQTFIDAHFESRKRSASECTRDRSNAKKLVALDNGSSSPVRSPARRRHLRRVQHKKLKSLKTADVTHHRRTNHTFDPIPSRTAKKDSADEPHVLVEELKKLMCDRKKWIRQCKKFPELKISVKKFSSRNISDTKKNVPMSIPTAASVPKEKPLHQSLSNSTKPCFARFAHLAVSSDTLVLPSEYFNLEVIFNGIETAIRSLMNKRERVTFRFIQHDVQRLTGREFTSQHLGMIKTIYPDAYELKYELVSPDGTMDILIEELRSKFTDIDGRQKMFHELLLERTKFHHQEFLKTLNPPLVLPTAAEIRRWHPLFDLNSVPVIPPISIPQLSYHNDASGYAESTEGKLSEPSILSIHSLKKALNALSESLRTKIRAGTATKMIE